MSNGTVFASDGSRRWQAMWPGPAYVHTVDCLNIAGMAVANAGRTVYAAPCAGGMWRSTDAGQSWNRDAAGLPARPYAAEPDLVAAPDQRTVYAAGDYGLYVSSDARVSWAQVFQPSEQDHRVTAVTLNPRRPAHLWLGTDGGGLYASSNAGRFWGQVGEAGIPPHASVYAISVSPFDDRLVYVSTVDGLYATSNGGGSWDAVSCCDDATNFVANATVFAVTFDPLQQRHLYAGTSDGVFISHDGGSTWTGPTTPPQVAIYAVAASASHPGVAYAGGRHVYRTTDGGATWQEWDGGDLRADDNITNLAAYLP